MSDRNEILEIIDKAMWIAQNITVSMGSTDILIIKFKPFHSIITKN